MPGDKSISHRALLLAALADGSSVLAGFSLCNDCLATVACVRELGVDVQTNPTALTVWGKGLFGLQAPPRPLDCGRSATTMRLLMGLLAGQKFASSLTGDKQLLCRPMGRVVEALRGMGARIDIVADAGLVLIQGRPLHGCDYTLPVASAQLKSALLLAGLYAQGPTTIHQPGPARDHTERLLAAMGVRVETKELTVRLDSSPTLSPLAILIPGDFSSAAFLLVAAALVPDSQITVLNVGVNPTRTGLLDVMQRMGARVTVENEGQMGMEPAANVTVRTSKLRGVEICGETVVRMIDEFPVLAVAATQAQGVTVVRDAAELRAKESDRIHCVVTELGAMGARIRPMPDGFVVEGPTPLRGTVVDSHSDHRLAMALAVAGLIAEGETTIKNAHCIDDSFPGFVEVMRNVGARIDL